MKKITLLACCLFSIAIIGVQAQTNALKVMPNGNVAIGQDTAAEKLDVNGNIKASGALIINQLRAAVGNAIINVTGDVAVSGKINATGDIGTTGAITATGNISTAGKLNADGDIAAKGRIKDKTGFVMPVGTILAYAGVTPPEGWILCDGAQLNRTDPKYAELFAAIGTAWGAPDASNFNVPDLRGMFLRGVTVDTTKDPDTASRTALKTGGNDKSQVGSVQPDAFQGHWHQLFGYPNDYHNGYQGQHSLIAPSESLTGHIKDPVTDNVNGTPRTTSETRPKNVYVTYIIKY